MTVFKPNLSKKPFFYKTKIKLLVIEKTIDWNKNYPIDYYNQYGA